MFLLLKVFKQYYSFGESINFVSEIMRAYSLCAADAAILLTQTYLKLMVDRNTVNAQTFAKI